MASPGPSIRQSESHIRPGRPNFTTTVERKHEADLTALARKYGHPYRKIGNLSHRVLKNTGKSGLTPLSPFLAPQAYHPDIWEQKIKLYYYQQHRYFSFTAAELCDLEVFSSLLTSEASISTLNNPIHPMYERSQWDTDKTLPKHLSFTPILDVPGQGGFWQVIHSTISKCLDF